MNETVLNETEQGQRRVAVDETIFDGMAARWKSSHVARTEVSEFSGGIISERYLANLDSQGRGPRGRIRTGRKISYPALEFARWLARRSEVVEPKQ